MKKLFVFIGIMLIACSTMGQNFSRTPLNNIKCKNGEYKDIVGTQPYLLDMNGKQPIIAYESFSYDEYDSLGYRNPDFINAVANREVHIFCDGIKVTKTPIQVDYWKYDSIGYAYFNDGSVKTMYGEAFSFYYTAVYNSHKKDEYSRWVQLNNGNYGILLTNLNRENNVNNNGMGFSNSIKKYETYKIIILTNEYNFAVFNLIGDNRFQTMPRMNMVALLTELKSKNIDLNTDTFELTINVDETYTFKK